MTDEEQYRSTIHIANRRGEVKGCGFVIDGGHVMTCAHVIDFCREGEATGAAVERSPVFEGFCVLGLKDGAQFRLRPVANRADLVDEDVAILELEPGERFHDDVTAVQWEPCVSQLAYRGSGLAQIAGDDGIATIQPVEIDGIVGGLSTATRSFVRAAQSDLRIEAGCSGGAVFGKAGERGLIGMVSEYLQDLSGTIIQAQALRDCWPAIERCRGGGNAAFVDLAPAPAAGGLMLADLDESIARCDREAQTDPFRDHIRVLEKSRRGALLTTIHGQTLDLPDRLSDRLCELGPRALVKRKSPDAGKPLPRPNIDMAKCAAGDAAGMRAKIEYRLQDTLQSDRADIAGFVAAIRRLGRPLAIEVRASEAFVAEKGELAARIWTKIAAELSAKDLGHPLFIFFVVIRSGEGAGTEAMARWTARDKSFLVLEELMPVPLADVESWSRSCYGEDLTDKIMGIVARRAGTAGAVRLKQVQDWLTDGEGK